MELIIFIGVFVLGISMGSFLNALVFRLGTAESILWGRSHCMSCAHTLEWDELIPLASFVALGGKCRVCHNPISSQYPIVELLTGAVFVLTYAAYKNTIFIFSPFAVFGGAFDTLWYGAGLAFYLCATVLVLGLGIYDFRTKIIAPAFAIPFFALALLGNAVRWFAGAPLSEIAITFFAALSVFAFFAGIWFFSRGRAMGFGDAEFGSSIVLFLGAGYGIPALLFAFWLGAGWGIFLLLTGRARPASEVPFGPFLAAGMFIAMFWGDALLRIYFSFF